MLAVARRVEVDHRGAGGKDAPVNCVGKGLLLGEAEARPGRRQRVVLLAVGSDAQRDSAKDDRQVGARFQRRAWLLETWLFRRKRSPQPRDRLEQRPQKKQA